VSFLQKLSTRQTLDPLSEKAFLSVGLTGLKVIAAFLQDSFLSIYCATTWHIELDIRELGTVESGEQRPSQ
jgi:hypothetical protein